MKFKISIKTKNKKQGFTLIEIITVIAIIGIISTILIPKVGGYINEGKKLKVIDQCKRIVLAVETHNLKASVPLANSATVGSVVSNENIKKYLDENKLKNINSQTTTLKNCYDILDGAEFELAKNSDILDVTTIKSDNQNQASTKEE